MPSCLAANWPKYRLTQTQIGTITWYHQTVIQTKFVLSWLANLRKGFWNKPNVSRLPHRIKFYELWHTVCAPGIKITTFQAKRYRVLEMCLYPGPITLQEILLTGIRPAELVCKGYLYWVPSTSLHRRQEVPNLEILDTNIAFQIGFEVFCVRLLIPNWVLIQIGISTLISLPNR